MSETSDRVIKEYLFCRNVPVLPFLPHEEAIAFLSLIDRDPHGFDFLLSSIGRPMKGCMIGGPLSPIFITLILLSQGRAT